MKLDPSVKERYPEFAVGYASVSGITVEPRVPGLNDEERRVLTDLKSRYGDVSALDIPEVKSYRAFFKAMGADPSSYRPAPEYLLRRALDDRFPTINNLVDACLLATVEHWITVSVYDLKEIEGDPTITLATETEPFELIDGRKLGPKIDEIVLRDDKKVISAYTLGDAKATKIKHQSSDVILVFWNAPGIEREWMEKAMETAARYARKYCGGHVEESKIL